MSQDSIARLLACDVFCFDVDSTISTEEGIDSLAEFLGVHEEVKQVTSAAMNGSMTFQEALSLRLDVMKPSKSSLERFIASHEFQLTDGVIELIELLRSLDKHIYLISGGFHQMIAPLCPKLGIDPETNLIANVLQFDDDGNFSGFDPNQPTSRSGGKAIAVQRVLERSLPFPLTPPLIR